MLPDKFIHNFIAKNQDLTALVVGETIIDEFITVVYEGQSMKSFCPVFRYTNEPKTIQQGGAAAIANHLKSFVKRVDFITNTNNEIVKTRLVDADGKNKHVEINKFDIKDFKEIKVNTEAYDLVIIADFGHGFCDKLIINDGFHLMCQTNSNNFGFNRVSKWKNLKKKSVCLDLREASLQMNKKIKFETSEEIHELFNYELNTNDLYITLGSKGAIYTNGKSQTKLPSFKSQIMDTIGAGDTFFTFACLASHLKMNKEEILIIPSLAASLSTTWLCNEQSVTPEKLLNYAAGII